MDEYDQFYCPKCGWNGIVDNLKSGFTFPNFCPNCGTNELNENFSGGENYRKPNEDIIEYISQQPLVKIKTLLIKLDNATEEYDESFHNVIDSIKEKPENSKYYAVPIFLNKEELIFLRTILENIKD